MGGGEKHIISILKVFEENGFDVTIFWDKNLSVEIKNYLKIDLSTLTFKKNIFAEKMGPIKRAFQLGQYDIFLYVTDGSYFLSRAKKNVIFCMVPQKNLYHMTLANRVKTIGARWISNSLFTKKHLSRWRIQTDVIYPYLDEVFFEKNGQKKENIILSVGRFFEHLHSKRHDITIKWFTKLQQENDEFKNYKLIIAGGLDEKDKEYFESLKNLGLNNPSIELIPNITFNYLRDYYKKSKIYIHMAGYDIDENTNPEMVEHLGITPLEAMASGCITCVYRAGGPKEIITNGENGYLFSNYEELKNVLDLVVHNEKKNESIRDNALTFVKDNFSYEAFTARVHEVLID